MISVCLQSKPFTITLIHVYAQTTNAKEAEVKRFYDDLKDLTELTPFHHRGLECKSRKSRDTWSNRQIWPWSTKRSRSKANRVLPRECTGHSKYPFPTTQEMTLHMDIIRWSILKSDIIFFATENGESPYSQQKQDQGLTVAQIMNSLLQNSDLN